MDNEGFKSSMNALEAGAKMGTELIKTTRDFAGFCAKLTGLTDDSIIGLINDKIQFFRYNRQLRIAEEYNKKCGNQPMHPIPPKFLIPILENGSLEEDNDLQDLWINLLGNWTKKENIEKRKMTYIDILKNLSMQDVKILDTVYKKAQEENSEIIFSMADNNMSDNSYSIKNYRNFSINRVEIDPKLHLIIYYESINNLIRLGCLRIADTPEKPPTLDILNITYLGVGLVEACIVD